METHQNGHTILVVDDEPIIRMYVSAVLEDAGYSVLEAKDCEEALVLLATHTEIEVLMTDVRMPGRMDGLQLVQQTHDKRPAICSIVVSGNATAADARRAGANRFVAKPYTARALTDAVTAAMSGGLRAA